MPNPTRLFHRYLYLDYIGCERRKLDTQRVLTYFIKNGYKRITDPAKADLCVLITCGFRKMFEEISFSKLEKILHKKRPEVQVIVGGCLTSIDPERFANLPASANIHLIETRNLDAIDALVHPTIKMIDIPDPHITVFDQEVKEPIKTETYSTEEHWEYWAAKQGYKIRVDEGCLGNCSFCVTRIATKRLTSIPIDTILSAFQEGIMKGYKTFLFTGDDTGAYGQDIGCTIVDLLTKILAVPGDYSVFFHDFNINWLMKYQDQLIPLFKANIPRLGCFNFPIQGSTDRILKLMRRPYTIAPVLECVKRLRHEAPGFKIGTHYVVGFPGETEAEIEGFIQLINECDFEFLVVFRYSDNPRADSSKLPNKIEKEIIEERASRVFNAFNQNYQKTHKKISNDIDIK